MVVENMTDREDQERKQMWKKSSKAYLQRLLQKEALAPIESSASVSTNQTHGRQRVTKNRSECYRTIVKLNAKLKAEIKAKEKYRKRVQLKHNVISFSSKSNYVEMSPATPKSRTKLLLRNMKDVPSHTRKTLLIHNVLMDECNETLKQEGNSENRRQKQIASGKLLKRYRITKFAQNSGLSISSKCIHANEKRNNKLSYQRKTRKEEISTNVSPPKTACPKSRDSVAHVWFEVAKSLIMNDLDIN